MGFIVGAVIGLGLFVVIQSWNNPHPLTFSRSIVMACGGAVLGTVMGIVIFPVAPLIVCCALIGAAVPYLVKQAHIRRLDKLRREAWPDVLDDVVSSLRAGLSVSQSLAMVGQRGPELMREPFAQCARNLRAHGRIGGALDELKEEFQDPMADRVIEAMRLSHELGGRDLAVLLSQLASVVREDNRARGELLARQSWTVNGARLAAVAPWLLLALFATRPGTIESFSSPAGIAVLCVGVIATVVAYVLMLKLGELSPDTRIFISSDLKGVPVA
ncbi:type II secretion system F family protein [Arcanobacterium phocae]|uniref:type II secretion system F family protein n=1 Tax=Arcanobacterium phocae TaxID=131112 RepID=UPI001C0F5BE8|nr:type II secretion system F family protein [Arcanobacterium phocae]